MSDSLRQLLAEARDPAGPSAYAGGVEAACAAGLVTDAGTFRAFLLARLWTAGVVAASAAAAICARARTPRSADSLFRSAGAELDARTPSPDERLASRRLGGRLFRDARRVGYSEVFEALARSSATAEHLVHHPVAIGAVAAVAGIGPDEAAEIALCASIAGPARAGETLVGLSAAELRDLAGELSPEIGRLSREAGLTCLRSLSEIPSFSAPALEYLALAQPIGHERSFAS